MLEADDESSLAVSSPRSTAVAQAGRLAVNQRGSQHLELRPVEGVAERALHVPMTAFAQQADEVAEPGP
jgi:hypothetical protein